LILGRYFFPHYFYVQDGAEILGTSQRTTSLSVPRPAALRDTSEERFFKRLESELAKVGKFTAGTVSELRQRLQKLQDAAAAAVSVECTAGDIESAGISGLLDEAKYIGDEFLQLEK
jgi:SPX domain protein involved in polyphosphate accumulation